MVDFILLISDFPRYAGWVDGLGEPYLTEVNKDGMRPPAEFYGFLFTRFECFPSTYADGVIHLLLCLLPIISCLNQMLLKLLFSFKG